MRTAHELAWAAGFVDGEGSFNWSKSKQAIGFGITQLDRRSLDRFVKAVGIGKIYGPYPRAKKQGTVHYYKLYSFESVQALAAMLWPWLGEVKRADARRVLTLSKGGLQ